MNDQRNLGYEYRSPYAVVTLEAAGGLQVEVWEYWYDDRYHCLKLDKYQFKTRPTRRHGFKVTSFYSRIGRDKGQRPDVGGDVEQAAKMAFAEALTVNSGGQL